MMKKALVGVISAGVLSVALAGLAWADPPSDPGSNGNGIGIGQGGIPRQNGGEPEIPGSFINPVAKLPGSVPNAIDTLNDVGCGCGPGPYVKTSTPGGGIGNGPNPFDVSPIPRPNQ